MKSDEDYVKMVNEIDTLGGDLSVWEMDFIDDMIGRAQFTPRQREVIERIWKKAVG